jgi:subtilisin-like proprotein convertase family protein
MRDPMRCMLRTLSVAFVFALCGAPVSAAVFSNNAPIAISDAATVGEADPYPAIFTVSGLTGMITDVDVELLGLTHTFPDDLDILLVSPNGTSLSIFSDAGGSADVVGVDVVLDDEAVAPIPDAGPLVAGGAQLSNYVAGDTFPAPAPPIGVGTTLAAFDGANPNGTWLLFVVDDTGVDVGQLGGVRLQITTTGSPRTAFATAAGLRLHDRWGFGSSSINVTGEASTTAQVIVTLNDVTHPNPDDLDLYLVSPNGVTFALMSDAGGTVDLTNVDIVLDDNATTLLLDAAEILPGTYRPTNFGSGDTPHLPALPPYLEPATAGTPPASLNSTYGGSNPNGVWTLYATDDATASTGSIAGGWSLSFRDLPPRFIAYGVTAANQLVTFTTQVPGFFSASLPIAGLVGGDQILALDFRFTDGALYGLGSGSRLYRIDRDTGTAVQVGSDGAFSLSGLSFGFDVNPVVDRIRVVSDAEQNQRIDPNGTIPGTVDTPLAYAAGDPNFGTVPDLGALAYTNTFTGATSTTLYGIDTLTNALVRQGGINVPPGTPSPNNGLLFTVGLLGINPIDDAARVHAALDIQARGVDDVAYAALTLNGLSSFLYEVDMNSGSAEEIGRIGPPATLLRAMTLLPDVIFSDSFE